jgi:hypothetical protein
LQNSSFRSSGDRFECRVHEKIVLIPQLLFRAATYTNVFARVVRVKKIGFCFCVFLFLFFCSLEGGDAIAPENCIATSGCDGCYRITCGSSFCLACCRERNLCMLCSSTLEIVFQTCRFVVVLFVVFLISSFQSCKVQILSMFSKIVSTRSCSDFAGLQIFQSNLHCVCLLFCCFVIENARFVAMLEFCSSKLCRTIINVLQPLLSLRIDCFKVFFFSFLKRERMKIVIFSKFIF